MSFEIEKIPIVLSLRKGTAKSARLLADHYGEDLDFFISGELEKIISALSTTPELQQVLKEGKD